MNNPVRSLRSPKKSLAAVRRHWMTLSFVFGFVLDNITLNRVDQLFDNAVLFFYVVLAMISLLALYAAAAEKIPERMAPIVRAYTPLLVQFSFGGLLSGMLIFYGRSGAWVQSWPFLLIILLAIYGNETIKDRSSRLLYNLAILFVGLFSYVVLVIPVFTGYMGAGVFVGSGVLALMIMYGFIRLLYFIIPNYLNLQLRNIVFSLGLIFVSLNGLYFSNLIPPIPLSLKDIGIYHSVVHFGTGEYQLTYEPGPWWQFYRDSNAVFKPNPGDNMFCFTKVFAPTKLDTEIYHRWEYYNPITKKWEQRLRISYPIMGGRNSGYRGYTLLQNYQDGKWRCSVESKRGQVLGREVFEVDSSSLPEELVIRID